jgi:hypothetical protein
VWARSRHPWCSKRNRIAPHNCFVLAASDPSARILQPHMGIILIWKPIVVSFADNKYSSLQPRAQESTPRASPVWSPGVRVESRTPKARPMASTGAHLASC